MKTKIANLDILMILSLFFVPSALAQLVQDNAFSATSTTMLQQNAMEEPNVRQTAKAIFAGVNGSITTKELMDITKGGTVVEVLSLQGIAFTDSTETIGIQLPDLVSYSGSLKEKIAFFIDYYHRPAVASMIAQAEESLAEAKNLNPESITSTQISVDRLRLAQASNVRWTAANIIGSNRSINKLATQNAVRKLVLTDKNNAARYDFLEQQFTGNKMPLVKRQGGERFGDSR